MNRYRIAVLSQRVMDRLDVRCRAMRMINPSEREKAVPNQDDDGASTDEPEFTHAEGRQFQPGSPQ
jgi:hypothetical protein